MGDKHGEPSEALKVLVYSDDHTVREQVKVALCGTIASDLPRVEVIETATEASVVDAVNSGHYDVLIADGESTPYGGMGVCHQLKDEVEDCPPVVLLVARVADAWLASWSRADAIATHPVDPVALPQTVASVVRVSRSEAAEPAEQAV
ncbi:response regulator [Cutibacterium equinum]|uniref:Response regulator n=1 Tax=Cutibacterium equinum TaxID=3016342 RepID=A0ABY7QZR5_9ACTN|nr:response regulator [Cutibacterium equinum]WCC80543.1 response regulator [Cutibacterium equinum]